MKTLNTLHFKIYLIVFFITSSAVMAQDDPGFPTEGDPGTTAPIDDWISPMILIVLSFVFLIYKKQLDNEKLKNV
jgi:hypothetical protein